jgi:phage terminase large subunit GpA-like protein
LLVYQRVVVMMGAQMGKTAGLLNVIGQKLDDAPVPMLYVGPTKSNVDRVIEPQIVAMLRSAPTLWSKTDRSRKAQKLAKTVNGVSLRLAWAGSPTELASQPAHTVLVDEIDRMEPIPGEGDPVSLAEARTTNYQGGRIIITSTPTEGNVDVAIHPETGLQHWKLAETRDLMSPVWQLWQEGTRHEWAVPCPHCADYFIPRFRLLTWPDKATPRVAKREARLLCPSCGGYIEDRDKTVMNAGGRFLAPGQQVKDGEVVGEPPESDTASFWVSGLMSPWKSFGERAADYVRALASGDQERLRVVINTGFGELYAFRGEAPPATAVRACAGAYQLGQIPANVRTLTCGVDVQKARLVYAVRGWGYGMESWLLDYGDIWGETSEPQVWADLAEVLEREYGGSETTKALRIRRTGIDSGYRPGDKWRRPDNLIYEFCLRHRRAVPTKGRDRLNKPLQPSLIDVTFRGQVHKQGLQLWHLDSDYFKSWVQGALIVADSQPRRFWVPLDISDDYCMQLTAEARVPKPSGLAVWVKIRTENHFLDCEAINVAMAQSLGLHRKVQPMQPRAIEGAQPTSARTLPPGPPPPRVPAQGWSTPSPQRRRNWTTTW